MILSIFGSFQGVFGTFEQNVSAYPLLILRFLVPVLLLFVATLAVQRVSKKEKIDSAPTVEQKREQFVTPDDFFNREVEFIKKDDYEHYLQPMEIEFKRIRETLEQFKVLDKLYKKYDARTNSPYKKRRNRAMTLRKEVFEQIMDLYNYLRQLKLSVVEYEVKEEERQ